MIDADEGEQHAAAGQIRPMLSIKQVLALIPFSRATLYREMEAGRFPAAHEIAPRRIARVSRMRLPRGGRHQEGRLSFPYPGLPGNDL